MLDSHIEKSEKWLKYLYSKTKGEAMKIKTNNTERSFLYAWDVPKKVLQGQFDYLENPDEHTFLKYKGHWYELGDFMRVPEGSTLHEKGYNGYHSDSFSSGVAIKLNEDGETYKIATYMQEVKNV